VQRSDKPANNDLLFEIGPKNLSPMFGFLIVISFLFSMLQVLNGETMFVGSYSNEIISFQLESDSLTVLSRTPSGKNPSWLAVSQCGRYIFAVNEVNDFEGNYEGAVEAYKIINLAEGKLKFINRVSSRGGSPAHLHVRGNFIYVSNYCSGSITLLTFNSQNGELSGPLQEVTHYPSVRNETIIDCNRKDIPHIHQVIDDEIEHAILSTDLGLDSIFQYQLQRDGLLKVPPKEIKRVDNKYHQGPGKKINNGPRRMMIVGNYIYVLNELTSTLAWFEFEGHDLSGTKSSLGKQIGDISTLRHGESNEGMAAAELQVSKDKEFLYVSNRDVSEPSQERDSIAVFSLTTLRLEDNSALERTRGLPFLIQHINSGGKQPRHFSLSNDERYVFVANMNSDRITTFSRNLSTGLLMSIPEPDLPCEKPAQLLIAPCGEEAL
jgi:6-phosphogluconolactonase